ncbi:hypothetical protein ACFL54_08990, partial [Planctomycetota bacterium]
MIRILKESQLIHLLALAAFPKRNSRVTVQFALLPGESETRLLCQAHGLVEVDENPRLYWQFLAPVEGVTGLDEPVTLPESLVRYLIKAKFTEDIILKTYTHGIEVVDSHTGMSRSFAAGNPPPAVASTTEIIPIKPIEQDWATGLAVLFSASGLPAEAAPEYLSAVFEFKGSVLQISAGHDGEAASTQCFLQGSLPSCHYLVPTFEIKSLLDHGVLQSDNLEFQCSDDSLGIHVPGLFQKTFY